MSKPKKNTSGRETSTLTKDKTSEAVNASDAEPTLANVIGLIEKFREETHTSINTVQSTLLSFGGRLTEVENSLRDVDSRASNLESLCAKLAKENASLSERLDDMETRSRRQNLRVIGIPEDTEGPRVTAFMEEFFNETLGMPPQPNQLPICDRAHRSLAPKDPKRPPRPIIVRVHHDQVRQEILRLSREKGELFFRNRRVHIFQDWPPEIARKRAAFKEIKAKMKDLPGVRYGLLPTAKLQVTFRGKREVFDKPEDAETFFAQTIAPALQATANEAGRNKDGNDIAD